MGLTIREKIIAAAQKNILFLPHAIRQMSRPDRMIAPQEVVDTIFNGDVIEEYLNDPRGESCLILHLTNVRALHVVCAPKFEYLAIITAYVPMPNQWDADFKVRKS